GERRHPVSERGRLQAMERRPARRSHAAGQIAVPHLKGGASPSARPRAGHWGRSRVSFYEQGSLAFVLSGTPAGTIRVAVHLVAWFAVATTGSSAVSMYVSPGPTTLGWHVPWVIFK